MVMSGDISGGRYSAGDPAGLRLAERMLRRNRGVSKPWQSGAVGVDEAGNILAGAYLTALSDFLDMD